MIRDGQRRRLERHPELANLHLFVGIQFAQAKLLGDIEWNKNARFGQGLGWPLASSGSRPMRTVRPPSTSLSTSSIGSPAI